MADGFATTQWTLVWKAASDDMAAARPALAEIIRRYWQPLYSFARRQGLSSEDAEDATQEFLSRILEGQLLAQADPARGKFRTYLLTAWKRFLIDSYRRRQAQRRGGQFHCHSLDIDRGEKSWQTIESREPDPDRLFLLAWAHSVLEQAQERVAQDYQRSGRQLIHAALIGKLSSPLSATDYAQLGHPLGLSASAVKVAMHRLRQRFASALREVIGETVDDPADIDVELRELLQAFALRPLED